MSDKNSSEYDYPRMQMPSGSGGHHHHHHSTSSSSEQRQHHHSRVWSSIQEKASKVFHAMAKVPFALALGLVVIMPLAYFGGERWWLPSVWLGLVLAYTMWGLSVWWCGKDYAHVKISAWGLLFLIPLLVGALQLAPIRGLTKVLSPKAFDQWVAMEELAKDMETPELEPEESDDAEAVAETLKEAEKLDLKRGTVRTRVSVSPDDTIQMCSLFGICLLMFILLTSKMHHTYQIRLVLLAIVATALGNAIFAFIESFGTAAAGVPQRESFNGVFGNRNHFAFMMMMGVMSTVGLMGILTGSKRHGSKLEAWWTKLQVPLSIILFVLLTAMVMSLSRGAFMATIVSLLVFGVIWGFSFRGQSMHMRQKTFALLAVVAVAFLIGMPFVLERLSERYEALTAEDLTADARYEVWKDSCRMIKDYWRFGAGLGGFETSIQPYEAGRFTDARIGHAHNDLLELTSEVGVPVAVALLVVALVMWFRSMYVILHHQERTYKWAGLGAGVALIGVTLHECVEFNLLAWSNALVFTALLSVVAVCGSRRHRRLKHEKTEEEKAKESATNREKRRQNRHDRWRWRLALIPLSLAVLVIGVPVCCKRIYAGWNYSKFLDDLRQPVVEGKPVRFDCERRIKMLQDVMRCWPDDHYVLWRSSAVKAEAADEYNEAFWKEACVESARSIMTAPGDGDAALQCAIYWEAAKECSQITRTRRLIIKLYDWAVQCQPTLAGTRRRAGMAAYRAYVLAESFEDPQAASLKKKAHDHLMAALAYGSKSYDTIFPVLADLLGGVKQLAEVIPDNLDAQKSMVRLLLRRRLFDEAIQLTDRLQKMDLEPKDKLDLLQTKCTILEMAGRAEDRADAWREMVAEQEAQLPLDEASAIFAGGDARAALNLLLKKRGKTILYPREILLEAQLLSFLGKYEETIQTLMRLAYIDGPVEREIIDEAEKLLGGSNSSWKESVALRVRFLEKVLFVKRGLHGDALARDFETIEKDFEMERPQWLQRHLAAYYAGIAWEGTGMTDEAIAAYRRCLDICPNHLWSLRQLAGLSLSSLNEKERSLLEVATKRLSPIAMLLPGLNWIGVAAKPDTLTTLYASQSFEYIFLCVSDVRSHLRTVMQFGDKNGLVFSDRIEPRDGMEYTLRVGEVMREVRNEWQPVNLTLSARRRIIANGDVAVQYDRFSVKAFKVDIQGVSRKHRSEK
ncbi:MAG: O-antigen ligase family protein [Lentisphaeria bacterium]|nr:O-antigen ligase family protein [Lentisphaeria bacterium]